MTTTVRRTGDETVGAGSGRAAVLLGSTGAVIRRRPAYEALAAGVLVPFLVLALRALIWSPPPLFGDAAVVDLQTRQAQHWQLLLGVYDRFGWHHPGPVYLYLISFVQTAVGGRHGATAQVATAALVNGLSAAGAVLVLGRRHGVRAALGAAVALLCAAALIGPHALNDPWTPYVVVLPLVLLGVLVCAAMDGSPVAVIGCLALGSSLVQTDISTLPLVGSYLVLAVGCWVVVTRVRSGGAGGARSVGRAVPAAKRGVLALSAVSALLWLPVIVQQSGGRDPNLTLLWRYFSARQGGLQTRYATSLVGTASTAVFGLPTPQLDLRSTPGLIRFSLIAGVTLAVLVAAVSLRSAVLRLVVTAAAGLGAAVLGADHITGMPWEYVIAWAAAPAALVLVAAGWLIAEQWALIGRPAVLAAVAGAAVASLTVVAVRAPAPPITSPDVRSATYAVLASHRAGATVGLSAYGLGPFSVQEGVADQLVQRGIPYAVPHDTRFQFPYAAGSPPSEWAAFTEPGAPLPPGYRLVVASPRFVMSTGPGAPPGW